jgi:hypothetical protein
MNFTLSDHVHIFDSSGNFIFPDNLFGGHEMKMSLHQSAGKKEETLISTRDLIRPLLYGGKVGTSQPPLNSPESSARVVYTKA